MEHNSESLQPVISTFAVVEEIDGVVFEVSALVIVLDDPSDVFVSGHALHLAVVPGKNSVLPYFPCI
jgi:hypothetical protein